MAVLLFADQTAEYSPILRTSLQCPRGPLLSDFLRRVHRAIIHEISITLKHEKIALSSFSNIEELVSEYEESPNHNAAVDSALVCLSQLTHFIILLENNVSHNGRISDLHVVGACTGLLAAAAVVSCKDLVNFIPLAVETVRVAFRVGLIVDRRASEIAIHSKGQCWSTVVVGATEAAAKAQIDSLNETYDLNDARKLYISSMGPHTATISGPPQTLQLISDKQNSFGKMQSVPILGPYHAPHIYRVEELFDLIPATSAEVFKQYDFDASRAIAFGDVDSKNALDLLHHCIRRILREPLEWANIIQSCETSTAVLGSRLLPMGSLKNSNGIATVLKQRLPNIVIEDYNVNDYRSDTDRPEPFSEAIESSKIAIVGMSGRFPGAANHEELWSLLERGLDVHRTVPPDRWNYQTHTDPSGKGRNKSHTPFGCFIDNPGYFDHRFFNMSPREAAQTDPMQRLALVTAYEALESSGIVLNRTASTQADRIATFYGGASDDWRETNSGQDIDTYFITGGIRAFGPGRINYFFGFTGPSYTIDTACSSGLAAIQQACTALKAKECDTVLAGGVNIYTNPDIFAGLSKGQFLSKTGQCKTFDDDADGYCRGEGVATVILKRLEDAVADKDPVLGVITAAATNHNAEAASITQPNVEAQEALFKSVLRQARANPHDVNYVEMHGTGTQVGDSVEMESVTRVFAPRKTRRRKANNPLHLGSVKANVGHGEAVSGLTSLFKVLCMLQQNSIPPHCRVLNMNRKFPTDLAERNVHIPRVSLPFLRSSDKKRRIFMNNFGAAGGNTALLVEDGPLPKSLVSDPRQQHIITVSAKTASSLERNLKKLSHWIQKSSSLNLSSLSYTTNARRQHYRYRVAFQCRSREDLQASIQKRGDLKVTGSSGPRSVVFVFTGQGCQYLGMGRELFNISETFRDSINNLDRISVSEGFPSFKSFINSQGAEDTESPVVKQLALVCLQIALARLWISWGVQPSALVGHSLGEYAALNIAGAISDYDVIYLVGSRACLIQRDCQAGTHTMLAVRGALDLSEVETLSSRHGVELACVNSPQDIVLAGPKHKIEGLQKHLSSSFKTKLLEVPFAFHSSQVDPIMEEFRIRASSVVFAAPQIPIISPLLQKTISDADVLGPSYLVRHCRERVDFSAALQNYAGDVDTPSMWLEIGPHPTCSSMVKANLNNSHTVLSTLSKAQDPYTSIVQSISALYCLGVVIDWSEYHRGFEESVEVLPLPTYSFEEKNFWIEYRNDWTLTKGEKSLVAVPASSRLSPSVQRIIKQEVNQSDGTVHLIAESDFADPHLRAAVEGHLINGVGLCPSSIYADMAMTLSNHGYKTLYPSEDRISMNVRDMTNASPFILNANPKDANSTPQKLEIDMKLDMKKGSATVLIQSQGSEKIIEHAKCLVSFESEAGWRSEWSRFAHLIKSRIDTLTHSPNVNGIQKGMAYKMFSNLVRYGEKYRGMQKVYLDSEQLEATARVRCRATPEDGSFFMSPYLIDNSCHISGFVMNANDSIDNDQVYISHGWESMRYSDALVLGEMYQVYVKMLPQPGSKVFAGDVYVLRDGEIIGVTGKCKFQCVPRTLLGTLLPSFTPTRARIANPLSPLRTRNPEFGTGKNTLGISVKQTAPILPQLAIEVNLSSDLITDQVLSILASEIGCEIFELTDSTLFSDMGVDSLLSLTILSKLREVLELDVDSTLFMDYPSVGSLKDFLKTMFAPLEPVLSEANISTQHSSQSTPEYSAKSSIDLALDDGGADMSSSITTPEDQGTFAWDNVPVQPSSTSELISARARPQLLLLQSSRSAKRNIFLFPDGSGSATSYALLPQISRDISVWGLNCPFMTTPENFTIGVPAIVRIYLSEIRKKQPRGPYIFGGWSAGGVLAFEAARQLISAGETVEALLLIDSPCPLGLEALPSEFHRFCADIGLLSLDAKMPQWLLAHFAATVRELTRYSEELEKIVWPDDLVVRMPRTVAIWAIDGVSKNARKTLEWKGRMPNSMQWLYEDRTDLGHNGWGKLLGVDKVECLSMNGNHFTMMREPFVQEISRILGDALHI